MGRTLFAVTAALQLVPYKAGHFQALSRLELPGEQERFTAYPTELIPATEADADSLGVTVLHGGEPIGYFVLSAGGPRDKYLPQPDPAGVAIRALSISERWQGRGIGTRAMRLLSDFAGQPEFRATFPSAAHFLLVVNQKNARARRVYEKVGFEVWCERDGGEYGPQWVMRRSLRAD